MLGGRQVAFVQIDDEVEASETAPENMNRLLGREKVDVVVGHPASIWGRTVGSAALQGGASIG